MRALFAALLLALAATAAVAAPREPSPWASLTADEQRILAPLQNDWPRLSREQKVKWLGIAKRYPEMKPEEQKRVQTRMQKWVKLTPEQRWQARERYRNFSTKVAPDRKAQLRRYWAEYQSLPPRERSMFDVPPGYQPPQERRKRAPKPPRQKPSFALP